MIVNECSYTKTHTISGRSYTKKDILHIKDIFKFSPQNFILSINYTKIYKGSSIFLLKIYESSYRKSLYFITENHTENLRMFIHVGNDSEHEEYSQHDEHDSYKTTTTTLFL